MYYLKSIFPRYKYKTSKRPLIFDDKKNWKRESSTNINSVDIDNITISDKSEYNKDFKHIIEYKNRKNNKNLIVQTSKDDDVSWIEGVES